MRINWKKRLGVCGGLTLLSVTVISGALASSAGAQVPTGELAVTGHFNGTDLPPTDFSFQVVGDGGFDQTFAWSPNGTVLLVLAIDQTYTVIPVPHEGFTASVADTGPGGITCTNFTVDPAALAFCLVTFDAIVVTTTTLTTTTTIVCAKPGWGYSDKNHTHCGPPGRQRIRAQLIGASRRGGSPDTGIFVTAIALATALTVLWPRKRSRLRSQQ